MKLKMFNSIEIQQLTNIVDERCSFKYTWNNYFGIDLHDVECYLQNDILVLKKSFGDYSRIYLMTNSEIELIDVLKTLPKNSIINIPSRKGIDIWKTVFERSGYSPLAVYRRYVYTTYKKGNSRNIHYAKLSDIEYLLRDLNHFFSPLTGHLPNKMQLTKFVKNENIVVDRDLQTGEIKGALCFDISGKRCELLFWFHYGGNGLALLYNVFYLCHEKGVKNILFWVNDDNISTIGIHKMLGAKEDGLVDYLFNK